MKKKSAVLYTCDSIRCVEENLKMMNSFPDLRKQSYFAEAISWFIINLLINVAFISRFHTIIESFMYLVVFQIFIMILLKLSFKTRVKKTYIKGLKKDMLGPVIHTEFYDDYFIFSGEVLSFTIPYSNIDSFVETDTNFYLKYLKANRIFNFQKSRCSDELILFLQEKFRDLDNNKEKVKEKPIKNKKTIFKSVDDLMFVLFVLTILSLFMGSWVASFISNNSVGLGFVKNMWVLWCFLPIPILSIILGFRYRSKGVKCTKNIVAGFIIGLLLLVYGAFCFFPVESNDYSEIYEYSNIVGAELPKNGEFGIHHIDDLFYDDKRNYTNITVDYSKEDDTSLVRDIKNSNHWFVSDIIQSKLKIFIPFEFGHGDNIYYSIYNKTLQQYNELPEVPGEYEIYAMFYDTSNHYMKIHSFTYLYR